MMTVKKICESSIICVLFFVMFLLSSCTTQLPRNEGYETVESNILKMNAIPSIVWENYVFNELRSVTYNRATGEMTMGLCENVECEGSCVFHKGHMVPKQAIDGVLYFVFEGRGEGVRYYCSKDILTGEIKVHLSVDYDDITPSDAMFVEDGYIYYSRKYLKEGGNPSLPDDYATFVCRVPITGGESETVYQMRGNSETLYVIADGMMLTGWEGAYHRIELDTLQSKQLLALQENEIFSVAERQYFKGKLYFLAKPEQSLVTTPNGQPVHQLRLAYLDTMTGEWGYLVDVPVLTYQVCDDAIYFSPVEIHQVNDPEIYAPTDPKGAKYLLGSSTLYACDHDGSNLRAVYTDQSHTLDFVESYTIADGVLYGWICEFDFEANKFGEIFFAEIHLDTGDVIRPSSINDMR